jgi:hypothetical protein
MYVCMYVGRLQSSWTHLITPSRKLWRCSDGLFFEMPPLASDALITTLHPLLESRVTVVLKEPFLGWGSNLSGASALRD